MSNKLFSLVHIFLYLFTLYKKIGLFIWCIRPTVYKLRGNSIFLILFPGDVTECHYIRPQAFTTCLSVLCCSSSCISLFLLMCGNRICPRGNFEAPWNQISSFPISPFPPWGGSPTAFDESEFRLINEGKLKDMALFF